MSKTMIVSAALVLALPTTTAAHRLPHKKPFKSMSLKAKSNYLKRQTHHARSTIRFWQRHSTRELHDEGDSLRARDLRWHRVSLRIASRNLARYERALYVGSLSYWIDRQIAVATKIGRESSGDHWPNCPDPFDGGGSWTATVACENTGNWLDSPGYYRCGLQFDPGWERKYGRLCP
jgi:hypothetical protein